MSNYQGILTLLVQCPNSNSLMDLYYDILRQHASAPGSSHNHQAWPGGWSDHTREVMNIAVEQYGTLNALRPLPFLLSDALTVLFLHDIEKPFRFGSPELNLNSKEARSNFRFNLIKERGIQLTPEQENAIKYCEGENQDYTNETRIMSGLAAFCNICDVISARIWYDKGRIYGW